MPKIFGHHLSHAIGMVRWMRVSPLIWSVLPYIATIWFIFVHAWMCVCVTEGEKDNKKGEEVMLRSQEYCGGRKCLLKAFFYSVIQVWRLFAKMDTGGSIHPWCSPLIIQSKHSEIQKSKVSLNLSQNKHKWKASEGGMHTLHVLYIPQSGHAYFILYQRNSIMM